MSKERRAVEKVIKRIFKERLVRTGKLPDGKSARAMEEKAVKIAMETDNREKRR